MPDSLHFKVAEFACHDGTPYPSQWENDRLAALQYQLEQLRAVTGPIEIVSGYRTLSYNRAIGGAAHSQHPEGLAVDARTMVFRDGHRIRWEFLSELERIERAEKFHGAVLERVASGYMPLVGGIGRYPGKWTHIDIRPKPADGHVARWDGVGIGSEVA